MRLESVCSIPTEEYLAFSADGRFLACVNEDDHPPRTCGLARVFDIQTGDVVWETEPPRPVETGCFLEHPEGLVFLCKEASAEGFNRLRGCRLPGCDAAPGFDLPEGNLREMAARGSAVVVFERERVAKRCEIEGAALEFYPLGRTPFPSHYHKIALHWPTRRLAAIGGGRCDIALIHN